MRYFAYRPVMRSSAVPHLFFPFTLLLENKCKIFHYIFPILKTQIFPY
ncbi:hypothetical protein Holit_00033 [Hollandina sp. SP2]